MQMQDKAKEIQAKHEDQVENSHEQLPQLFPKRSTI